MSPSNDLRFLGAMPMESRHIADYVPPGNLVGVVGIAVGFGSNFMNAIRCEGRIILNNGFHRVVTLRRLGIKRIPMVLQLVSNPQLEVPPELGGFPREMLITDPRPALVKDFLEPEFILSLDVRERVKLVNLSVQVGEQELPA